MGSSNRHPLNHQKLSDIERRLAELEARRPRLVETLGASHKRG